MDKLSLFTEQICHNDFCKSAEIIKSRHHLLKSEILCNKLTLSIQKMMI